MATKQKKQKTSMYTWEGVNRQGKPVKGETEGSSDAQVKSNLRKQGINPKKVRKKPKPLFEMKQKITPKDVAVFTRQLATMLQAGLPIVQAFDLVGKSHENPSMQKLLGTIQADIEGGTNLTEALSKHPLYFDPLYCNLVGAGEQAGILDGLLDKIATYKEKTEAIKGKIKSALSYPISVVVIAFIITAILLIFVIPQFESLFADFGAELPALTVMIIDLSKVFTTWWWLIFGSIAGGVTALSYGLRTSKKMQDSRDRLLLRAPVIGVIIKKATIARFCRTLSTMFAAGVPLVDALDSVAGAAGNVVYFNATMDIKGEVSSGTALKTAMETTNVFPNMVVQMIGIGEESGELDAMLAKVADIFEQEVDEAVEALSSLLEPIIMAFLGVVVGGMVLAMYLPIFKLASVV